MADIVLVLREIKSGKFDELHGPEQGEPWQQLSTTTNRLIDSLHNQVSTALILGCFR